MQPKPEPKLSRDIGVGRLPCTKWTHTHTLLRGCFQWPPSQIAVPSSSDQNLNAPWRCLGLLLASHQNIRRLGKETEHKSQATFLPNAAWPKGSLSEFRANLGLQTSGFCFALQPGDATYDHDQGCDYDEVIACNMYFAVPVLLIHFYMQYIYISGIIMPHQITFLLHGSFQVYVILHITFLFSFRRDLRMCMQVFHCG